MHACMYIGEDERDDNQLYIEDLQDVYSLLFKKSKDWFELGLALGIQVDILEGIKFNENRLNVQFREMLAYWLRSSPSRTWSDICNGLRSDTVQQYLLADTIEGKYKGSYVLLKHQLYLAIFLQSILIAYSMHKYSRLYRLPCFINCIC